MEGNASISVSIDPRDQDVELAQLEVIRNLLSRLTAGQIAEIMVEDQQVIMQARRLQKATIRLVEE
jgi:hypothetical protein